MFSKWFGFKSSTPQEASAPDSKLSGFGDERSQPILDQIAIKKREMKLDIPPKEEKIEKKERIISRWNGEMFGKIEVITHEKISIDWDFMKKVIASLKPELRLQMETEAMSKILLSLSVLSGKTKPTKELHYSKFYGTFCVESLVYLDLYAVPHDIKVDQLFNFKIRGTPVTVHVLFEFNEKVYPCEDIYNYLSSIKRKGSNLKLSDVLNEFNLECVYVNSESIVKERK